MANSNNKFSNPLKILGFGIAEVIFFLFVTALFFGVLNYFNILSLSQIYPNLFGSLPQKSSQKTLPISKPTLLTSIPCPINDCSNGRIIATTSGKVKWYGLIYTVPPNTNVKAVFQGTVDEGAATGGSIKVHPFLKLLKDNRSQIKAEYEFFGLAISPWKDNDRQHGLKIFNTGDLIGFVGEDHFPKKEPLNGANLILSIKQNDKYYKLKISGDRIDLTQ